MKKPRYARLLKIAKHLREKDKDIRKIGKAQVGHPYFYFGEYTDSVVENKCGTQGCAIGDFPILFPKYWKFKRDKNDTVGDGVLIALRNKRGSYTNGQCGEFLNLQTHIVDALFYPNISVSLNKRNSTLTIYSKSSMARPLTVAKDIEAFVKWAKRNKWSAQD